MTSFCQNSTARPTKVLEFSEKYKTFFQNSMDLYQNSTLQANLLHTFGKFRWKRKPGLNSEHFSTRGKGISLMVPLVHLWALSWYYAGEEIEKHSLHFFSFHHQFMMRTMETSWHVQIFGLKAWLGHVKSIMMGGGSPLHGPLRNTS